MDAVSHCAPGYRFQYQVPPKSPPFSMMRTSDTPASMRRAPVTRPAKPPPTNAKVTWSVLASRDFTGMYGSSSWCAKRPFSGRYCALPSGRSRLSRSALYLASKAALSICGWGLALDETVVVIRIASPARCRHARVERPLSRTSDPSTRDHCRQAIHRTATSGPRSERPLHIGNRVSGFVSAHFPDTSATEVNGA